MRTCMFWRLLFFSAVALPVCSGIYPAYAELSLEAGVHGIYEDNVISSPADVGKKGDYYTVLSAAGSLEKGISGTSSLFFRGMAEHYFYSKYSDLNVTSVMLNAGIRKEFSPILSLDASLKGGVRDYSGSDRSGTAYGGGIGLKQQASFRLWFREEYEYEKNDARSASFSYAEHTLGIHSGYILTPRMLLNLGAGFARRKFENENGDRTNMVTLSAGLTRQLRDKLYVNAGYAREFISSTVPAGHSNNIYSLGLLFRFR